MTKLYSAQLEIDADRGVIYVHSKETGITLLRICGLPTPIPTGEPLDISLRDDPTAGPECTHQRWFTNWKGPRRP
jgi:hypothetical protein